MPPDAAPSHADLVARARALVPVLAARAEATERNRALLAENHAALTDAGLLSILHAPRLGGQGGSPATHLAVAAVLAEGCGSTAWMQALIGYQNFLVGWYPPDAQDEVRADGRPLFAGLVMGPPEVATRVPGGVRLSGRWPYVSGADHATWMMLSARAPEDRGRVLTCLIPRAHTRIEDDWQALGMRGTGSKTVLLDDVFVPDHRVLAFGETERHGVPGRAVNAGAFYNGQITGILFAMVIAAPALGLAAGALEAYRTRLATRWNARMPAVQTDWPSSQAVLGRAAAEIEAARQLYDTTIAAFVARIEAGEPNAAAQRVRDRMAVVQAVDLCTRAVYALFCDAGTGVMVGDNPLQRAFRDIHVLRSHFVLTPAFAAENAGRVALDLPPKGPFA